eukprot:scaffold76265_cov17-Prasinocladus_malaysianus.AAC.1
MPVRFAAQRATIVGQPQLISIGRSHVGRSTIPHRQVHFGDLLACITAIHRAMKELTNSQRCEIS